jgi:hypothetical protein
VSEAFQKRGHADGAGYGYKPDRRHLFGAPVKRADHLDSLPTPPDEGGLDEDAVRSLGILDQGGAPFCVSHGIAGAVRDCRQRNGVARPRLVSRLWIMYLAHAIEHDPTAFDGAFVSDGFTALQKLGAPPEDAWPYSDSPAGPYKTMPPPEVFREAYDRIAPLDYSRILAGGDRRIDQVMRALAFGGKDRKPCPVVFGTQVSNAFASGKLGPGFVADVPPASDIDGGHCMRIIRYRRDAGAPGGVLFRVVNSWSEGWVDRGMCWITAAYLASTMTEDVWLCDDQGGDR